MSEELHAPPAEPNFFGPGSPYLNHPLLTDARTRTEVDHLVERLALDRGTRILDIGCGFGRHCIELARRGFDVVGIDPSSTMIDAARTRASAAGVAADFRVGDIESLDPDERFDTAICLFTTLGQIDSSGPNTAIVKTMTRFLQPGSPIAFEVPQLEPAVTAIEPCTEFDDGSVVERRFNPANSVVQERFHGDAGDHVLRYQLFTAEALIDLVKAAGYHGIELTSGYAQRRLEPDSPFIVLTARS